MWWRGRRERRIPYLYIWEAYPKLLSVNLQTWITKKLLTSNCVFRLLLKNYLLGDKKSPKGRNTVKSKLKKEKGETF